MNCSNCQNPIQEGEKFCGKCGKSLDLVQSGGGDIFLKSRLSGNKKVFIMIAVIILSVLFVVVLARLVGRKSMPVNNTGGTQTENSSVSQVNSNSKETKESSGELFSAFLGGSPLDTLISSGWDDESIIKGIKEYMSSGTDVNSTNKSGGTPLMTASRLGKIGIVKFLLDNGAEVEAKDKNNDTAIRYAATYGKVDTIKLLIDRGADVNTQNKSGYTTLMAATGNNPENIEIVRMLVENGAQLNVKNHIGITALTLAIEKSNLEAAAILLKAGADPNIQSNHGLTTLDYALVVARGVKDPARAERLSKLVDLVKEYGGKVSEDAKTSNN